MKVAVSVFVAIASIVQPVQASACECDPPSLDVATRDAKLVLVGTISEMTKTVLNPERCSAVKSECRFSLHYKIVVESMWKGDVPPTIEVDAGTGAGDCSFGSLSRTDRWLIIADTSLVLRMCSGTQPATADVIDRVTKLLGAAHEPVAHRP